MSSIFKEARLKAGLDISDVARELKVKHQYLRAIEDGDLSVIPGQVYVNGYRRMYAKYLGIDITALPVHKDVLEKIRKKPQELKNYTGYKIVLLLSLFGSLILSFLYGFSEVEIDRGGRHFTDIYGKPSTFHNHHIVPLHKEYDLNKIGAN